MKGFHLISTALLILVLFGEAPARAEACPGNDRIRNLLTCAADMHNLYYNRPADQRQQALTTIFQGIQPGIRWSSISCPDPWVAVDGRGNSLSSEQRSLFTFPVIRPGSQGGGYQLFDLQRDASGCFQARRTDYVETGNATGPVSIPFREQRCRVSMSTAGPSFRNVQMALPISRYLGDLPAGRNVQSSAITYGAEVSGRGRAVTEGPVPASRDGIQNLLIAELRTSLGRLTESVASDTDVNRSFWRDPANARQLQQLLTNCEMKDQRQSFGSNLQALEFFLSVDELRESFSALTSPAGAPARPDPGPADDGTG